MMQGTQIIDGKLVAAQLLSRLTQCLSTLEQKPRLVVIIVGTNPASVIYTRNKHKKALESGMESEIINLDSQISQRELEDIIIALNKDPKVSGILVQLPLPPHLSADRIISIISPLKDVDGFHPQNVGEMVVGKAKLLPCTPLGCLLLLRTVIKDFKGLNAVIVGRSNIVGKPMLHLLLQQDCTVTIVHSHTRFPEEIAKQADILVAAVGRPELINEKWVKPGAVVIDVGINRVGDKITGDVDFAAVSPKVSAITPVPGGVGPMTIACLLGNTYIAHCLAHHIPYNEGFNF